MRKFWIAWLALVAFLVAPSQAEIPFEHTLGPAKVKIGSDLAVMDLPEGFAYLDKETTVKLLKQTGNFPDGNELGCLLMEAEEGAFWVVISYEEMGYVKDDDAADIDADELLDGFREGTAAANEERKKQGMAPLNLVGWGEEPRYEPSHHHLVWALIGESEGDKVVNFNTRVLGREGVMSMNLICSPDDLPRYKPVMNDLLKATTYVEGKRYADYKEGDKVSEAGLIALVAGGAAAAKLGFFAKIGKFLLRLLVVGKKFIVIIAVGAFAFLKNLFRGGGGTTEPAAPEIASEDPPDDPPNDQPVS